MPLSMPSRRDFAALARIVLRYLCLGRAGSLSSLGVALCWIVLLQSPAGVSQEIHSQHCLLGCPYGSPSTNDLLIRDIYILSSNDETKLADWVAYRVDPRNFGKKRKRDWRADPWLAENETLERQDYRRAHSLAGYDRGHQAPLGSFSASPHWYQTNFLSNITPQRSALNQGPWRVLEERIRKLAKRQVQAGHGILYVMTGPIYDIPQKAQVEEAAAGSRSTMPNQQRQQQFSSLKAAIKANPFGIWLQKSWWQQLAAAKPLLTDVWTKSVAQYQDSGRDAKPKDSTELRSQLPSADESHRIPSHYWKVVAVQGWPTIRIAAFIMPQTAKRSATICGFGVPLAEIERATGLTFFHRLGTVEKSVLAVRKGKLSSQLGC